MICEFVLTHDFVALLKIRSGSLNHDIVYQVLGTPQMAI